MTMLDDFLRVMKYVDCGDREDHPSYIRVYLDFFDKHPEQIKQDMIDADRYRWLRENGRHTWYGDEIIDLIDDERRLDAAIDAARSQK